MSDDVLEIATPHGPARAHLRHAARPQAALLIGHGAGGSVEAPDLLAAVDAALATDVSVARIEQPYRAAGRRSAPPAPKLDEAWLAVHAALTADPDAPLAGLPVLSGGRSSGARVACRTATATGVIGVLCLAFPLHPPQRKTDTERKTRLPELEAVTVPVLIIQGDRDPFGMPPPGPARTVITVAGNHSLKVGLAEVGPAVSSWLAVTLP
ncbi:MAG TPA: alpha/beta family hydrolase [Baekduia sp.]|nr:alpha/beta family hydrolase [Baekduia sp.]